MKRFAVVLAGTFLAFVIAGCGGGLEEGMPQETTAQDAAPPGFRAEMEKNAGKMAGQAIQKGKKPAAPPEKKPGP
jgi:hypothetical protein